MNKLQREFLVKFLFFWLVLFDCYFFWYAFIHQYIGLWNKSLVIALMSSLWSWLCLVVLSPITVLVWVLLSHQELLDKLKLPKIQRKKGKTTKKEAKVKASDEELPLY